MRHNSLYKETAKLARAAGQFGCIARENYNYYENTLILLWLGSDKKLIFMMEQPVRSHS